MPHTNLFYRFGIALFIGILVGLQREYAYMKPSRELFAGVRTFSLFALVGCTAAMLSDTMASPLPFAMATITLGGLIVVAYFVEAAAGELGLTTETAAILTFLTGALCYWAHTRLAVAIAVAMAVLLSLKPELHKLAETLTREDIYATLKFAVISAIILPILPNQAYGPAPLNVLNPYDIWLMVVFISGLSFLGYILIKIVGAERGIALTGLLGGIASSTAVTLSFTQRSKKGTPDAEAVLAKPFALALIIAWTVMFIRVLIVVGTLNPSLLQVLWIPMLATMLAGMGYGLYLYFAQRTGKNSAMDFSNPFDLSTAIKFGLIYAVALIISKAAQVYFGNTGIYISSLISGLADVDAIALSMVKLSQSPDGVSTSVAARHRFRRNGQYRVQGQFRPDQWFQSPTAGSLARSGVDDGHGKYCCDFGLMGNEWKMGNGEG
ncbi:MAG: MgtC/SapB family protein [Anaerolineae bacterium]|nr:MgtC/SapB family protein [Anaerolineae bacterium]